MAIGIYVLSSRTEQVKRILARNKWVVVLFIYMSLSIIWSNFPAISLVRMGRVIGALEMVLVVLTERYPFQSVYALLRRLYLLHIPLSAIAIKWVRIVGVSYNWSGLEESWIGLSTDKNSLGQVGMCSGIFWLWQMLQDWDRPKAKGRLKRLVLDGVLLGLTIWMLKGSKTVHSSTAIVGFIMCSAVLLGLQLIKRKAKKAKQIVLGTVVASLILGPVVYLGFNVFDTTPVQVAVEATGRDMSFTDRTLIWTDVLNTAKEQPVLGVGIGALWVGPIGYDLYPMPNWSRKTPQWRPEEAHNGYIDTFAQLGAVGFGLLLIVIWCAVVGALDDLQTDFQFGSLRLPLLLGILFNNMSESSFLLGTHDLWFLFLLTALNVPKLNRKTTLTKRANVQQDSTAIEGHTVDLLNGEQAVAR